MKTAREYQEDISNWANINFDYIDQVGWGIIEEVGEYCRAILKYKQHIRRHALKGGGTSKYEADLKDSIADGMIFSLHWAEVHGVYISFEEADKYCIQMVDDYEYETIARLLEMLAKMLQLQNGVGSEMERPVAQRVFNCFAMLAKSRGWQWQRILSHVWKEVRKRNWKLYPTDGKTK